MKNNRAQIRLNEKDQAAYQRGLEFLKQPGVKGEKMSKVMVFNFETMRYEQASAAEGKEWLGIIESMNAECATQHRQWTLATVWQKLVALFRRQSH